MAARCGCRTQSQPVDQVCLFLRVEHRCDTQHRYVSACWLGVQSGSCETVFRLATLTHCALHADVC